MLGVDRPNKDYLLSLRQIIDKQIQELTVSAIAERFVKSMSQLREPDIDYIKNTPQKRLLMFPVHKGLTDKLALLAHLKENLARKFLSKIKLQAR